MLKEINVKRLAIGMYVNLDGVSWLKHPFLTSQFMITKKSDITTIASLGKDTILYDPLKSTTSPLKSDRKLNINQAINYSEIEALKGIKASELRRRRKKFQEVEKHFSQAQKRLESILSGIKNGHISHFEEAKKEAASLSQLFNDDFDLSIQHISQSASDDGQHFHGLNVAVLSLTLGAQLGLSPEEMETLSFGALVHDIGFTLLSKSIRIKPKLTQTELKELREHPRFGVALLSKLPDIDREVMKIVYQHHEEMNGNGYPKGVKGENISPLARIVALADIFDRMINTRNAKLALSPHTALAYLYGKKRECYDTEYLTVFIKMLGVYPPGTICRFTTGEIGSIVGTDPNAPLKPEVILYDPSIPKHDAIIYKLGVDLNLTIQETVNPNTLDEEIARYLDSRANIQYFPAKSN